MIENIDDFVKAYKQVNQSHIDVYLNDAQTIRRWTSLDFDVRKISAQLDKIDNLVLYSTVKKAYDTIRTYHRTYMIYLQSRDNYYDFAEYDLRKDLKIIDVIVNNLNTLYTKVEASIAESQVA